jgi:hypothetical protein
MNKLQSTTAGRASRRMHRTDFSFAGKRYRVSLDGQWTPRRAQSIAAAATAFALKQAQKKPQFVYFVECDERIKIGVARDPERRLRSLQTGNPSQLRILAVVAGDADLEQAIHAKFESTRIGGEWFCKTDQLNEFIERVTTCNSVFFNHLENEIRMVRWVRRPKRADAGGFGAARLFDLAVRPRVDASKTV